jgi:hypothetical protein
MARRSDWTLLLAVLQAGDLVVAQVSPKFGDAHLDHLGVPYALRPVLPAVKLAAVVGLVVARNRPALRSMVAAGLVAYYSAAVTFHRQSGDAAADVAPAAAFGVLAAAILLRG